MKILLINTGDRGGAANSCLRLHNGFLEKGLNSKILLRSKTKYIDNVELYATKPRKLSKFQRIKLHVHNLLLELGALSKRKNESSQVRKIRSTKLELFSGPESTADITDSPSYQEADIINLHWVANFLDYKSFFEKNKKPVVWTLHDMNPFTGGEHYEEKLIGMDADGFPRKREILEEEKRISKRNLSLKLDALKRVKNLTIVSPSKWLADEASKSELFAERKIVHIPNGIDSRIFAPRNKAFARDLCGIPLDKKIVLFVSDSIDTSRKGFEYLKKAFEHLDREDTVLCAIGHKNSNLMSYDNIIELGAIHDQRLMSAAFSAADVFVIPSLMDNLPNTVLEALMCGTPVVGFPVGGIQEMVQNWKNGLLTEDISVPSLVKSLKLVLGSLMSFDRSSIRNDAVKKYDLEIQTEKYSNLFKDVLKECAIYN